VLLVVHGVVVIALVRAVGQGALDGDTMAMRVAAAVAAQVPVDVFGGGENDVSEKLLEKQEFDSRSEKISILLHPPRPTSKGGEDPERFLAATVVAADDFSTPRTFSRSC